MAQLVYEKDPAPATQGQMAEPMAPMRIVSRLVKAGESIAPGVPVAMEAGSKQIVTGTVDKDSFAGVLVLQDYLENKPTGTVDAGTGEIMTEVKFKEKQQCGLMQEGSIWVVAGEAMTSADFGLELEATATGGFVKLSDAAVGTASPYKVFLSDVTGTFNANAALSTMLVKVLISGPQGAPAA